MRDRVCDLGLPFMLAMLVSCLSPASHIDRQAQNLGLRRSIVEGTSFDHMVFRNQGSGSDTAPLHVYLEGDGSPWIGETRVAMDPTPRRAYALELMALDPVAAMYVGRPCYQGLEGTVPCNPSLWTTHRYSEQVVESMAAAIRRSATAIGQEELVLIGYSGGGVLAMLMADRLEGTRSVVTVAANLDIDAWTELHKYSPLSNSLNPATRPSLPPDIRQYHLAGGQDQRVPARIIEAVARDQPNSEFLLYPDFDHICCWQEIWPDILDLVARSSN